jgi:hypothetical protein
VALERWSASKPRRLAVDLHRRGALERTGAPSTSAFATGAVLSQSAAAATPFRTSSRGAYSGTGISGMDIQWVISTSFRPGSPAPRKAS